MNPFNQRPGYSYKNQNKEIEFILWAPTQQKVSLKLLSYEVNTYDMQVDDWGYWKVSVQTVPIGTRYLFVLDDGTESPDPASVSQPEGVFGASQIIDRSMDWTDHEWQGIVMKDLILYELHTGTFTPEGTFEGIITKLDYLKELGITAIELMPIAQFSGHHNWGYDGVFYFAVQNSYGTAKDLKLLVNEAHQRNIAVILDVVFNHTGPEGSCLKKITPVYYTHKYNTPWGDAFNLDGPYSNGVRNFFIQNALMWLDEFHIDGLRLDAVHSIEDKSAVHFVYELKQAVDELGKRSGKCKLLIAELDLNDKRFLDLPEQGGYGLDGQWVDEFHHALRSVLTGETQGYYEDFGTLKHLENAYKNTYVYNGIYSRYRKKIFGTQPENPYYQYIIFTQNHDQIGNRPEGDRLTMAVSFEALKLSASAILLSPYVPLLFMGEEYAEQNPFLYFVDHTDEVLKNGISDGRKKEFCYFNFENGFPVPHGQETFQRSKLSWNFDPVERKTMLAFYKHLIRFRKLHPVMQVKERGTMIVHAEEGNMLSIERFTAIDRLLIVMNTSKQKSTYTNHSGFSYQKLMDSSDLIWGGPARPASSELKAGKSALINPLSVSVYQSVS